MSKALILVGGGKGGVGKSLFSMAVVDFLESTRRRRFWSKRTPQFPTSSRRTGRPSKASS